MGLGRKSAMNLQTTCLFLGRVTGATQEQSSKTDEVKTAVTSYEHVLSNTPLLIFSKCVRSSLKILICLDVHGLQRHTDCSKTNHTIKLGEFVPRQFYQNMT
jgi:hypothetical protein